MPRKIVPIETGEIYHVFNRGVDKRVIFESKSDYIRFYLSLDVFNALDPTHNFEDSKNKVRTVSDKLVQVHAYSLLPNHFHLLIEQLIDGGLSEFMKRVGGGYTSYFNERNDRSGSLFQGTFKRIRVDTDSYLQHLFAYVNENHYVHKVQRPDDICYSSSRHYQGLATSKLLPTKSKFEAYNFRQAKQLALEIARQRCIQKTEK